MLVKEENLSLFKIAFATVIFVCSILVLFIMLKHLNVGTNVRGEFFPLLHLNITLFISVTQKEGENVYLYGVCEFLVTLMRTKYMQMVA